MTSTELHLTDCLNCIRDGCHLSYCKRAGSSYSLNTFRYMWATACCPSLTDSATAIHSFLDSVGNTPPPSTAPVATAFPRETWLGNILLCYHRSNDIRECRCFSTGIRAKLRLHSCDNTKVHKLSKQSHRLGSLEGKPMVQA